MTNSSEIHVTKTIMNEFMDDFIDNILDTDIVIVGSGPCGVTAAKYAAELGHKTVMIERNIYGRRDVAGGFLLPKNTVMAPAHKILEECGVRLKDAGDGLYVCDSFEMVSKMLASACDAGAKLLNSTNVEDLVLKEDHVDGVVIQWFPSSRCQNSLPAWTDRYKVESCDRCYGHDSFLVSALASRDRASLCQRAAALSGLTRLKADR